MSKQMTLGTGFEKCSKTTRREKFLAEMDRIVPWGDLCTLIAPVYPKARDGRPPKELEMMLRVYFLQQWFNLRIRGWRKPSTTRCRCAGLRASTLGKCRCPMNPRCCVSAICSRRMAWARSSSNRCMCTWSARASRWAPARWSMPRSSPPRPPPRTRTKRRDPAMHQTRKGNQWYFGMKAHIGVDSQTKLIHAVVATPANVHDSVCLPDLLHEEETRVWGDSAYQGQSEVIRKHAPKATDFTHRRYRYKNGVDEVQRAKQ